MISTLFAMPDTLWRTHSCERIYRFGSGTAYILNIPGSLPFILGSFR